MQWLTGTNAGEFLLTMLVSMVPVIELRGGIPFGVAAGLPVWMACVAAMLGNMIPVPFIIVYIRRVFRWLRSRLPRFNHVLDRLERKAHLKGRTVKKYQFLGLAILVAIPLPGTGAWTGALVAAFLDMRLKKAVPWIALGIVVAGILVSVLTFGIASLI
ncbi:MAG: small multi-drug export protein [Oscillospiraceae bacterium]|nr:small multi-drug export protein [Oscillospiraceae bacterium]